MANELKGKRVAFLFTDGAEQVEVTEPLEAVRKKRVPRPTSSRSRRARSRCGSTSTRATR